MKTVTLDCETTGLPAKGHTYDKYYMDYPYIVTFAYKINAEPVEEFIINQEGRLIPEAATAIHGITNEMAETSPHKLFDVLAAFVEKSKGCDHTIGHNIYFDSSTIKANILRLCALSRKLEKNIGMEMTIEDLMYTDVQDILHKDKRIDTMQGTMKFCNLPGKYPGQVKWPKLVELHEKLFPGETFAAHTSGADVDATYKCYLKLKELGVL